MTTATVGTQTLNWPDSHGPAPRWATSRSPERPTYGPAVAEIAEQLGTPLMPWQRHVVDVALEVRPDGSWAYSEIVITIPRQAGKTTVLRPITVHRCLAGDVRRVFLAAQTRKHSRRRWMDACSAMQHSRLLKGKTKQKVSNGFESLEFPATGSSFEPFAPSGEDLHGETPDLVLLDEIWAFTADEYAVLMGAIQPGFTTKDGQTIKTSTAGTAASYGLNEARERGRAAVERGDVTGIAYFEWSLPDELDGVALDELDDMALLAAVLKHHPARCQDPECHGPAGGKPCPHGFTVRDASIAESQSKMDRSEFLRGFGNRSTETEADRVIPESAVTASSTVDRIPADVAPGIAFDVDPDRRCATITAGWRGPDGRSLVEIIEHGLGTRWVAGAVIGILERQGLKRVTVNNAGPARDVADEIERSGFEVDRVTAPDYAAACVRFHDEIRAMPQPTVLHYGQADLVEAFGHLAWRRLGQSLAFTSSGEPVTAVTAAALAVWAADHPAAIEPPLPRSQVF
ncbi:hypothetical protein GCM10009804_03070 [Kribbella hippodromi]|uniref:Terminase large subunit-like ATPase domain-containing protein n=1 Tax=Kribbella hippodromi TaxID=434347 RepID=A0ABN2BZ33_9ACTN